MFGIPRKAIIAQLKRDLIGKDSHRGVTLTYAWLANQFGHFALGFIPSFIAYIVLDHYTSWDNKAFWAGLMISCTWLLFEIYNFLGPLLLKRISNAGHVYMGGKSKYVFQPTWRFIAFDTATDVLFFAFGSFSCATILHPTLYWNGIVLICIIVLLLYPIAFWFTNKIYLMNAGFPKQFRLSQWNYEISENNRSQVLGLIDDHQGKHVMIFGSVQHGKSELAVGMATQLATKKVKCSYHTGTKLYSKFYLPTNPPDDQQLWDWDSSDCLIVDDINSGNPVRIDNVTPDELYNYILGEDQGERNIPLIREKHVIWVMGEEHPEEKYQAFDNWQSMLMKLGVDSGKIVVIDLGD